jgi:hypothetical protein
MLPAQRSTSVSSLRWFNIPAIVAHVQAWIRQEIVDDDPWDVETLHPESPMPDAQNANSEKRHP